MAAAANPKTPLTIAPVRLRELHYFRQLFKRAVHDHFAYFPQAVQCQVVADHSLPRLLRAHIDPRRIVVVARAGQNVVGYCIGAVPSRGPAQLFWLYVEPDHRGTNTGLSLLSRTLRYMEDRGAEDIYLATHDHRHYYERQGFTLARHEIQHGIEMDIMQFSVRRPQ